MPGSATEPSRSAQLGLATRDQRHASVGTQDATIALVQDWPGPRRSAEAESERRGRAGFVAACADLAVGTPVDDPALILALGGPPARWALTGEPSGPDYWLRTWALRGLLWVWDDDATDAVLAALDDEHWRVREMAAKVVARHGVEAALERVAAMQADAVRRVRNASCRALAALMAPTE